MPMTEVKWKQYFQEFCRVHGDFVEYLVNDKAPQTSGYLLFSDGWMYSRSGYQGPEVAPPADKEKHLTLIRRYWKIRKNVLIGEYSRLKDNIILLMRTQQDRSVDLQVPEEVWVEDGDFEKSVLTVSPINFRQMLEDLEGLSRDIKQCDEMIEDPVITGSPEIDFNPAAILARVSEIDKSLNGAKKS